MKATHAIARCCGIFLVVLGARLLAQSPIGQEISVARHLADGEEFTISLRELVAHGAQLFSANWTSQEGGGRPLTKGTGASLSDPSDPLVFPRNFNRVSAPDANSCAGCHNAPFGILGGGGDIVANVFVLGHRFDFATMNLVPDGFVTKGTTSENGLAVNLQSIGNSRNTLGMFGSGYIEMLARQITADLQAIRDRVPVGGSAALIAKGISFGTLARTGVNSWNVAIRDLAESVPMTPKCSDMSQVRLPTRSDRQYRWQARRRSAATDESWSIRSMDNHANHLGMVRPTSRHQPFAINGADQRRELELLTLHHIPAVRCLSMPRSRAGIRPSEEPVRELRPSRMRWSRSNSRLSLYRADPHRPRIAKENPMKRTLLRTLSASVLTSAVLMADGGMTRQEPGELRAMSQRTTISPDLQSTAHAAASLPVAPIVHWSLEAQRAIVVRPVLGVRLSRMSPLALESPWQFRPDGPNSLTSAEYAADLEQVKQLGRVDSAARTVEQTIQALFWTDHDLRQWNEGMLRIADSRGLGFVQTARMLAMAHVSGGDAMIACFDAKYHYMFWRPAVAIPQAHIDGNPMTEPDPTWRPLRATPNHPEYPAAHACHTTAIAEALATFFGTDKISLTLDSRVTGTVREYDRLREAVRDVNRARVLAGFHFRNSDQEGSNLGRTVARFVVRQFFQPLD